MSRTYSEILDEVMTDLGIGLDQGRALTRLNDSFRFFWDYYPWKETLGEMDPFYLIDGFSVYKPPLIVFPSDFRDVYTAELLTLSSNGSTDWRPLRVIGNMDPVSEGGYINSVGYNPEYKSILVDAMPTQVVCKEYISIVYKKDYPYSLTADVASDESFTFLRDEGPFKAILGWYLSGSRNETWPMVQRALMMAQMAESPGKQAEMTRPEGLFSGLGR